MTSGEEVYLNPVEEIDPYSGISPEEIDPYSGISPEEIDPYSGFSPVEIDPYSGISPVEIDPYSGISPVEVDLYAMNPFLCSDIYEIDPYSLGTSVYEEDPYEMGYSVEEIDPYSGREVCSRDSDCLTPGEICVERTCVPNPKTISVAAKAEEACSCDSDCLSGQVCTFASPGAEAGKCVDCSETSVVIRGIQDEKTCSYCRSQIGKIRSIDSNSLPPFHEHCRCWGEYA